jgi:hypothetical protein
MSWLGRMQTPFDTLAKGIIDGALGELCDVTLQAAVVPETLYSDAVIDPRRRRRALQTRGMLGRMATTPCAIEAFAVVPSLSDLSRCVARVSWLRAERRDERVLWIVSPGLATSCLRAWSLRDGSEWGPGVFVGESALAPRIIAVNHLPAVRDTLLLRLMGRRAVLREALRELERLPDDDAWERPFVAKVLLRLRDDLATMTGNDPVSTEVQVRYAQIAKEADEMLERARGEGRAKGKAEGEAEGMAKGMAKGMAEGEADALRTVLLARGFTVDRDTDARIARCKDTATLRAWIVRAVSAHTLDDVFAP